MNTFIKGVFLYGLGAATGAFVAIKLLEDHYAQMAEDEIEEIKEHSRKKIADIIAKYEKQKVEAANEETAIKNKYAKLATTYGNPTYNNPVPVNVGIADLDDAENEYPREDEDYDDIETMDELEEEMYAKEAENDRLNERFDVEPYLITEEEFSNENTHYEKETLWYYELDKTLSDDNEEIIVNAEQLIGDDTLIMVEDERTVYIRNDRQARDFEIICLSKSYAEEVCGQFEEEDVTND